MYSTSYATFDVIIAIFFLYSGSCQQLYLKSWLLGLIPTDGVYHVTVDNITFPVYCDMSRDGGGWTLLLFGTVNNRVGNQKWTAENVKRRNENNPGITSEFSILYRGDSIKAQGTGNTFQVMYIYVKNTEYLNSTFFLNLETWLSTFH